MQTRTLTLEEKNWLRANAVLPTIMIAILLAIIAGIFACLFTGLMGNVIFMIFLAISGLMFLAVLAAVGVHVYNNYMDLRDGVVQVRQAELTRKHHTSRSPKTFYAEFTGIGDVIIMGDVYEKIDEGKTYYVSYSPRTRRGWELVLKS